MTSNSNTAQKITQYYTGESIAEQLTQFGTPSEFAGLSIAPQVLTYNFNLLDFNKINTLKNSIKKLELLTGLKITQTQSKIGHFALILPRSEREILELITQGEHVNKLEAGELFFGINTNGEPITAKIKNLPHLLIAGTTGSGKTSLLNSLIIELALCNNFKNFKLILIDLKRFEFTKFSKLPHLKYNIITEPTQAENLLHLLINEMERRYKKLQKAQNKNKSIKFKTICVVIDELNDLILQNKKTKILLVKLLQKSRACGIYFIIATQSPRASILDGSLLANLPSRIALTCASSRESILILGHKGAEELTGNGDAIIKLNGTTTKQRIQTPYITAEQIKKLII